ncbi:MAG TPA: L-histidine N(alpha)-methyltransferase [Roseiflexaceae bacterium]|nr:L-histidine N(alpha)-methyltransferase [Roseiflexaceae bacterium]
MLQIRTQPALNYDLAPEQASIRDEVLDGLRRTPKELPPKLFYDERGSQLFDQICELHEYYPTRTEVAIMQAHAHEMAALIGPDSLLVEYGSGSSLKTRILLDHLVAPGGYVPIDISREHLLRSAERLAAAYPDIEILPVWADYTAGLTLPHPARRVARAVAYFPGSTIGNCHPHEAVQLLRQIAELVGPGGGLLIGVDLQKDRATLERAYNDRAGVTAAFNLNMLARINRELGVTFRLEQFRHRALYNEQFQRIEMHLVSQRRQVVDIDGLTIAFEAGESILTECSYKYSLESFGALARVGGFEITHVWTDPQRLFSVQYLVARGAM